MCLWDKFLEMELLDQRVDAYVVLLRIAKFSFMGFILFSIPTSKMWENVLSAFEFVPIW